MPCNARRVFCAPVCWACHRAKRQIGRQFCLVRVRLQNSNVRAGHKDMWNLSMRELTGLALYSCAFPFGIYLESQLHLPNAFLLSLLNLPFLVILGPLIMGAGPLLNLNSQFPFLLLAWGIIFAQSYLAFVFLRRRAEHLGISISKALVSSIGRLGAISLITLAAGGFALALLFRMS